MRDQVIFKHELPWQLGEYIVPLHDPCEILDVQIQKNKLVFWERHDDNGIYMRNRRFFVEITGHAFHLSQDEQERIKYLGTVQSQWGAVHHVFVL